MCGSFFVDFDFCHLPSSGVIAKIVLRDRDLLFKVTFFYILISLEQWELAQTYEMTLSTSRFSNILVNIKVQMITSPLPKRKSKISVHKVFGHFPTHYDILMQDPTDAELAPKKNLNWFELRMYTCYSYNFDV